MKNSKGEDKVRGTVGAFIRYVTLNVSGMIGLSCYILADTYFVSKALGTRGLAALNLAISIYSVINATGLMLGIGGATRYSIFRYQDNKPEGSRVFSKTVTLSLAAGLLFLAAGIFLPGVLSGILGADGDTAELTTVYLRVILCFAPCFIMNNTLLAFVRNDGNPRRSMAAMIAGSLSNIILDYVFMFPLSMGMFGAAFATGLAPVISMAVLWGHFLRKKHGLHFTLCRISLRNVREVAGPGVSSFITEVSSGVVLMVFNLVILGLAGNTGVAAYGIVANMALVAVAVFTGIAQGIQPLASQGCGLGDEAMLKQVMWYGLVLSLALAAVIYFAVNRRAEEIIALFNSEGNKGLVSIAKRGIQIYFAGFLLAGVNIVTAAFLSAVAETKKAFGISAVRGFLAIVPLALLVPKVMGLDGVWLSFVLAELAAACISAVHARRILGGRSSAGRQ
ncbi:MAG: MATE family efflux transporter [Clostridium sp.]|nr:MATE family efflux transporter [Clostridium sp.]